MALPEQTESAARAGRRPDKPIHSFGDALDSIAVPGQTSTAELRQAGRIVIRLAGVRHGCDLSLDAPPCTHERHDADMDAARDALQAIGLIPTRPVLPRFRQGARNRVRGTCPTCGYRHAVDLAGVMGAHNIDGTPCAGVGERPLEATCSPE